MRPTVQASPRTAGRKSELTRLRRSGYIPASVYGKTIPPTPIAVEEKEMLRVLQELDNHIMEMDIPGQGRHPVLLKEMQRDKLMGGKIVHVDFCHISLTEPVRTTVRIELTGVPQGIGKGVVLQQVLEDIEVKAMPEQLPGSIAADVGGLVPGETLTVADLAMPDGVTCLTDPTALIATLLEVQAPSEAEVTEMTAEAENGGGLKESSGVKKSDRLNARDALEAAK